MWESRAFLIPPGRELSELSLALDKRQSSEILSIQVQQIERDEDARRFSEEKVFEDWPALIINARNLAIEDRGFNLQMFSDPGGEIRKASEDISFPRNQFTLSRFNVCECAETVDL